MLPMLSVLLIPTVGITAPTLHYVTNVTQCFHMLPMLSSLLHLVHVFPSFRTHFEMNVLFSSTWSLHTYILPSLTMEVQWALPIPTTNKVCIRYVPFLLPWESNILLSTAFFVLKDRGMGIYSLHSYIYEGFRLRMMKSVLKGKVQISL